NQPIQSPLSLGGPQHGFALPIRLSIPAAILPGVEDEQLQISAAAERPVETVWILGRGPDGPVLEEGLAAGRHQWLVRAGEVVPDFMVVPGGVDRYSG